MVILRLDVVFKRHNLDRYLFIIFALLKGYEFTRRLAARLVDVVDARAILATAVIALLVDRERIDDAEIMRQNFRLADDVCVVF